MPLDPGTRLGSFEIITLLGLGGMGEVYKARDIKLGREVAIKILPEAFSKDKERLARFEREARLLASLNHPNIATIHDLEEFDGVHFLVLEFVPGETLAERISRGLIPVGEALPLFKQIAEALEAAHEKGVIHRDLKPANVKVTPEGKIKVLDFGLAKAFGEEPAGSDLSQSPTMTRDATRAGVILGTAAYMSPEQARGKGVDKRTDIWAFGCCLYEALTGRKAFDGETVTDVLAKILERGPQWEALPGTVPTLLRRLLRRCLEKDPGRRLHDVADARIEIEDCLAEPSVPVDAAPKKRPLPLVVLALLSALALGIAVWALMRAGPVEPRSVKRLSLVLPSTDDLYYRPGVPSSMFALSPDGLDIIYAGTRSGVTQLFLRPIDRLEAIPLRGTEDARNLFFSPDGQWIGFFAQRKLKKVSLAGGPPVTICDGGGPTYGGAWGPDDTIYFGHLQSGLFKVPAAGGTPQPATNVDTASGETAHRWPQVLPGGKAVLYTAWFGSENTESIAVHSLETDEGWILIEGGSYPRYVSSGHIIFAREDSLLAAPFDLGRLEATSPPVPILERIQRVGAGLALFSVSREGTLAYVTGDSLSQGATILVRIDRQGVAQTVMEMPYLTNDPRLSPDGRRLAVSRDADIWTVELAREAWSRLTFDADADLRPRWSRDAKRIFFTSSRHEGTFTIFSTSTDGSGGVEQLATGAYRVPTSLSSDGKTLIFRQVSDTTGTDIGMLRLDGEDEPEMLLQTRFDEHSGILSPDGRWLAYVSNESGLDEVYVKPFPGPGGLMKVSTEGGREPLWSRDGRELFYRDGDKMMAVAVSMDPEFRLGKPTVLFEGRYRAGEVDRQYDLTSDGQHFYMIKSQGELPRAYINIVLNWFEELKRLVPTE